ncbi:MAG: LPS export ABC transporter permease LptF [Pseudomonadales bacterium]
MFGVLLPLLFDRYLIREISVPFVVVSGVLISIYLTFSLTRYLTDAVDGLIPPLAISQLAMLKAIIALEVLLPLALYLALLIGLGRLHADLEITALRASGIGEAKLMWPLLRLTVLLAAMVGLLSWFVRPWAYAQIYHIEAAAEANAELDQIRAGKFYLGTDLDRAVFVDRIDSDREDLHGIFVRTRSGDDLEVVSAPEGTLTPYITPTIHLLSLRNARIVRRSASSADLLGQFETFNMQLKIDNSAEAELRIKSLPSRSLRTTALDPNGDRSLAEAEYQWRLTTPIVTLLLTLLALPLSRGKPRSSRFGRVLLAMILYALYYNLIGIGRSWVEQKTLPHLFWIVLTPLPLILLWLFSERIGWWRLGATSTTPGQDRS